MLVVDHVTIREDWQRAIVARDIAWERERLAALEADPTRIPVIDVGLDASEAHAVSALANLLYAPDMAMAVNRERRLMREWPAPAEEAKRLLRRQIRIHQTALDEYDKKEAA